MRRIHFASAMAILCVSLAGADPGPRIVEVERPIEGEEYSSLETLREALAVYKEKLLREDHEEYVDLLKERRVREAIRKGIESYRARLEEADERNPGSTEYFEHSVLPVLERVAEGGWTEQCSFFSFYQLGDSDGVTYDGLGLRLNVRTPGGRFEAFALPVVDVFYGRFAR